MSILNLPVELIYHVLTFLDWHDIIAFICTTRCITERVLSKSDLRRLRSNCRDLLLAWEAEEGLRRRTWLRERKWKDYFLEDAQWRYPCYTCLRQQPNRLVSDNGPMSDNSRKGLGQADARRRICIPCGVRTGFYRPGSRVRHITICEECICLLDPWWGWPLTGETYEETEPVQKDGARLEVDAYKQLEHWWWLYTHVCWTCAARKGWTVEDILANPHEQKRKRVQKERQRAGTIAVVEMARARGRAVRARLGIQKPEDMLDAIESLRINDDGEDT